MTSIFLLSASLTYVATCHHHPHKGVISLILFDMQVHALHTNYVYNEAIYLQTSWWRKNIKIPYEVILSLQKFLGRYNDPVSQYNISLSQMFMLVRLLFTHCIDKFSSLYFTDLVNERTVGVNNQQDMLTPPRHLIQPLR